MTTTVTATLNTAVFGVRLEINGLPQAATYQIVREGKVIKVFHQSAGTDRDFDDFTAPFGVPLTYEVRDQAGHVVARSNTVVYPYSGKQSYSPAFDVGLGDWPVLRAIGRTDLPIAKVPVSDLQETYPHRTQVDFPKGSPYPVTASEVGGMKSFTLVVLTATTMHRRTLSSLFRPSVVLHMRAPCLDSLSDVAFIVTGDISVRYERKSQPHLATWQIPCQQVPVPAGWGLINAVGGYRTWDMVASEFADWDDVETVGSWDDLSVLPGQPSQYAVAPDAVDEGSW